MSSGFSGAAMALAVGAFALGCGTAPGASSAVAAAVVGERPALRICADPNNLPFSNHQLEGFENELAALVAADLGVPLEYTWWPQRRGFTRLTLNTGACDVIAGVPKEYELALTTEPYYTSSYVFVTRGD